MDIHILCHFSLVKNFEKLPIFISLWATFLGCKVNNIWTNLELGARHLGEHGLEKVATLWWSIYKARNIIIFEIQILKQVALLASNFLYEV